MTRSSLHSLLERVRSAEKADSATDIAVDIALFEPDSEFVSVRSNAAGTKLVYARRDGSTSAYWPEDHTLNSMTRANAIALLSAKLSMEEDNAEA